MGTPISAVARSSLILCLPVVLSGCWGFSVKSYQPEEGSFPSVGRFAALEILSKRAGPSWTERKNDDLPNVYMDRIYPIRYDRVMGGQFYVQSPDFYCRYRDTPNPEIRTGWMAFFLIIPVPFDRQLRAHCSGDEDAVTLIYSNEREADAWASLARYRPMNTAEFDAIAERSRGKRVELSEDVRGFKVRAENAVREKKYWQAADLLDQGLMLNPAWAQGHYNLGLICEELGLYDVAIDEMQKYLKLMPKFENARAIQDKIHIWQGKLRPL